MKTFAHVLALLLLCMSQLVVAQNTATATNKKPKYEKITLDEFAATVDSFKNGNRPDDAKRAYKLWKNEKWAELEALFKTLNIKWPPMNGGYDIIDSVAFVKGQKFDRYGNAWQYNGTGVPSLGGSFTSPILDGKTFEFDQRALDRPAEAYDFYYEIEILQDLPFTSQYATVIPWFGKVGGAQQNMWYIPTNPATGRSYTYTEMAQQGWIKITIKANPNGKFPANVNTTIP